MKAFCRLTGCSRNASYFAKRERYTLRKMVLHLPKFAPRADRHSHRNSIFELPQERGQRGLVGMDQVVDLLVQVGLSTAALDLGTLL